MVEKNSMKGKVAAIWQVRIRLALKQNGAERRFHDFYRGWVLWWMKFIRLRKFEKGNLEDVRSFYS